MHSVFKTFLTKNGLYLIILLVLPPALLINLGLMPFIDDEAIRALVALEMKWSGNYFTPTLHGTPYLNKPPLFNWLVIGMSLLTGQDNEWTSRLTNVAALCGISVMTGWVYRRIYDLGTGLMVALMVLTTGRILFWDALLGLIDLTFAGVIFGLFVTVYYAVKRQHWLTLFLGSYFLCAVGFLLKGLPALVFQAITLFTWLLWTRHYRKLWSWEHVVGALVFILIIGGYYSLYLQHEGSAGIFTRLVNESTKRTVIETGWWKGILHIFSFPVEMTYHFLPWSLLTVYFFRRRLTVWAKQDPFWTFQSIILLANMVVYWVSPNVFPRYLFMFLPLYFGMLLSLHRWHRSAQTPHYRMINLLFVGFIILVAISAWIPLFLDRLDEIAYRGLKVGITAGLMVLVLVYVYKFKADLMIAGVATLLIIRMSFNWFVLPDRLAHDYGQSCRQTALEIGSQYKSQALAVYGDTEVQPTSSYYLTISRGTIIPRKYHSFYRDEWLIVDTLLTPDTPWELVDSLPMRHFHKTLNVGRLPTISK